ncbi:MAG: hypothetical protein ACLFQE_03845 [Thermotogota bacterium]
MPLFFGVLLLVIGILLVFGLFDASIFSTIFENLFYLWPFILILIGLSILSKIKGLRWLRFINAIFIILFALALIFYPVDLMSDGVYEEYPFQIALNESADKNIVEIDVAVLYLEVMTDETLTNMISGTYYSNVDDTDVRISGNRVRISRRDENKFFIFRKPKYELSLRIPENTHLELLIDSAVLKSDITIDNSAIDIIDVNTAILNMNLAANTFSVPLEIICESAINNLNIKAPADLRFRRMMESAINKITIDDAFQEVDYDADLDIEIHAAINNFNLKQYE